MRLSYVVLFAVLCAMGACVYHVANLYQTAERRLKTLDVAIERERENIRVLSAEWAYLTNPVRMEKLAQDYLHLQAMDGSQLVAVSSVPLRTQLDETYPHPEHRNDHAAEQQAVLAHTRNKAVSSIHAPVMQAVPVSTRGMHE